MSNPIKAVGDVIEGAADVVGDVVEGAVDIVEDNWEIAAIAAAAYFTGGFGLAPGAMSTPGYGAMLPEAATATAAGGGEAVAEASSVAEAVGGGGYVNAPAGFVPGGPVASSGTAVASNTGSLAQGVTSGLHTAGGLDPAIESAAEGISPNMEPSQVSQNVDSAITQAETSGASTEAAQQAAQQTATPPQLQSSIDEMVATNPGMFEGPSQGGFMSGVKKVFSGAADFAEEHPYLTMMGAQTLSNLSQPSLEEQHEIANRWPGAFFGMEHDGRTVTGKPEIKNYAPGTEPQTKLLGRARAAASGQSPNVDPSKLQAGVKLNRMKS